MVILEKVNKKIMGNRWLGCKETEKTGSRATHVPGKTTTSQTDYLCAERSVDLRLLTKLNRSFHSPALLPCIP